MKKIFSFNISKLRIGALIAFFQSLILLLKANQYWMKKAHLLMPKFEAAVGRLVEVHSRHRGNLKTKAVQAADRRRDAVLTNLFAFIAMMATDPDEAKRTAAETLKRVKKDFGNISNMPYNVQTGTIVSLLNDLRNFHAAEVETLGIGGMLDEVEAANNAFVEIFAERNADDAPVQKGDMQAAQRAAIKIYREIEFCLNAEAYNLSVYGPEIDPGIDTIPNLIDLINSEIEHQKISLALSKKSTGEETDGGSAGEETEDGSSEEEAEEEFEEETF